MSIDEKPRPRYAGRTGFLRGFQFRALAILFAALLAFGIVETVLRTTPLGSGDYRSTAVEPEIREPGILSPDFRGSSPIIKKPPDTYRILLVGDSYAWGWGVERHDVFPARLERLTAPRVRWARLEVLNWSRPGWNTTRQRESLRGRLDEIEPDLVLWSFVLNDAEPSDRRQLHLLRRDISRRKPTSSWGRWLYEHSLAFRSLVDARENVRLRRALIRYYHGLYGEHRGWQAAGRALKRVRAELRRRRVPMALVVLPVFDSQLDDRYPYVDLHTKVAELAASLDIPVLDLLATYRGIDPRRLAVVPFTDPHPNEVAHRIAAQGIFDFLATWKIIRPSKTD